MNSGGYDGRMVRKRAGEMTLVAMMAAWWTKGWEMILVAMMAAWWTKGWEMTLVAMMAAWWTKGWEMILVAMMAAWWTKGWEMTLVAMMAAWWNLRQLNWEEKPGGPPADQLQLMLDNTPLKKMRDKNAAASQLLKDGDLWGVLKLRQDCLALAKIYFGPYHASFKAHVNLLMGESLISEPPKPQIALQHFAAAARSSEVDEIALQHFAAAAETSEAEEASDPSMKFLIGQSLAIIGSARLVEAHVTRQSMTCLEARLVGIKAKLEEIYPKIIERLSAKLEEIHPKSMERFSVNIQTLANILTLAYMFEFSAKLDEIHPKSMEP
eukprot:gene28330-31450_t